jgi:DNA-binding transcriptional LysR family regulator
MHGLHTEAREASMELDDLRCFLVVAEVGSLTRASETLYLSQPALSRMIRRMESATGARLIQRHSRGVQLTHAGEAFAAHASQVIATIDTACAQARVIATDEKPLRDAPLELRVGMLFPAAAELTQPIIDTFRRAEPNIHVAVVDIAHHGGERSLLEGQVDVAFLWSPISGPGIEVFPTFVDECVALLSENHPLAKRAALDVSDLRDEAFTSTKSMSPEWRAASTLDVWRHSPQHAVPVPTVVEAMQAIAQGRAVSIGPRSLARYSPTPGIRCIPLNALITPTSVVCMRQHDNRPHARRFVRLATDLATKLIHLVPEASPPMQAEPHWLS